MDTIKRLFIFLILLWPLVFFGCAPVVKTDLKSLLADPEKYKGSEVIVTSDIKSVLQDKTAYRIEKLSSKDMSNLMTSGDLTRGILSLKIKRGTP